MRKEVVICAVLLRVVCDLPRRKRDVDRFLANDLRVVERRVKPKSTVSQMIEWVKTWPVVFAFPNGDFAREPVAVERDNLHGPTDRRRIRGLEKSMSVSPFGSSP